MNCLLALTAAMLPQLAPATSGLPSRFRAELEMPVHPDPQPGRTQAQPDASVPPNRVIADFLAHVTASESYDRQARDFVRKAAEGLGDGEFRHFIDEAFAVLSPPFKTGLDLHDAGKPRRAVEVFGPLARSEDPFLAMAAVNLAATALIEIAQTERCEALLVQALEDHGPVQRYTLAADHMHFMLGYCRALNLDYDAARATLDAFLCDYPEAPRRLRDAATRIVEDLSQRVPGRLADVRDLLAYAGRKLGGGETGEPVVSRQHEAIAMLDRLIRQAEQQEKSECEGQAECKPAAGKTGAKNKPSRGAKQSTLPGGEAREGKLRSTRAVPGQEWGKMPPKQREEILQSLQRQFPARYRDLVRQYYSQLAKDGGD